MKRYLDIMRLFMLFRFRWSRFDFCAH